MNTTYKKPVTLITGYLGSGKTTVLNELLKSYDKGGLALIVNDMGSINVDARLLKQNQVMEAEAQLVEMQNGCICCTLQEAFMIQIERLAADEKVTSILVEASGISNPAAIAEGFITYQEEHPKTEVFLSTIVTVVDADRIYTEFLQDITKQLEEEEEEEPDIINLVMDQIEFCNTIILNKCDLLTREKLEEVKQVIHQLQPEATLQECVQGKIDPDYIFKESLFDYDKVMNSSAIQKALMREKQMMQTGKDEYGVSSFVYEAREPFDYDAFMAFMDKDYPETLIRAKGYIWFAHDDKHVQLFEQAGRNASIMETSRWIATYPEADKKEILDYYPEVRKNWDETYGDRMNQIVFIGRGYDKAEIVAHLNDCLIKNNL